MNGMELMLKSLGFDPSQFQEFLGGLKCAIMKINADLEQIKRNQAIIMGADQDGRIEPGSGSESRVENGTESGSRVGTEAGAASGTHG